MPSLISRTVSAAMCCACVSAPVLSAELEDAAVLFQEICLAADGDINLVTALATSHGFVPDEDMSFNGRKFWRYHTLDTRLPQLDYDSNSSPDTCSLIGNTEQEGEIVQYARQRGLKELPDELVIGDLAGPDTVYRAFTNDPCWVERPAGKGCTFVLIVGDRVPEGSGEKTFRAFRHGTVSE
jgi:hypothetical protein